MSGDHEERALARYFEVCGENASQPASGATVVNCNGLVFLQNIYGLLAVVALSGAVFDRVGGHRLDEVSP